MSFPLLLTQLVEDFCVTLCPLLPTPISEDRISPPISGPLEITYNSNIFIESGTNISSHFPQRKQRGFLKKISQLESDEAEETGSVLYCHLGWRPLEVS